MGDFDILLCNNDFVNIMAADGFKLEVLLFGFQKPDNCDS